MSQSLTQIYVHIVFHIKQHGVKIPTEIESDLYAYLGGICRKLKSTPIQINGMEEHVHILCILSKNLTLVELIQTLKSNSSSWIKTNSKQLKYSLLNKFQWQGGYGAFSVSVSQLETVNNYIKNQNEHHKLLSFKDELLSLLKKHNIKYDEKYLWE